MRLRFRLLTMMILVAITALAAWGYTMKRRSAERARQSAELARRSAEFTAKAEQHHLMLSEYVYRLISGFGRSFRGEELPWYGALDETPQEADRRLSRLEEFYGYGLTKREMERHGLDEYLRAQQMLTLLWLRYEVHMYFKYRRAAARPWLAVDPDPPNPPLGPLPPRERGWWKNPDLPDRFAEYLKMLTPRAPG
jgi:hypothetical protein